MPPVRFHHLLMSAFLFAVTVLLLVAVQTANYDLCVQMSPAGGSNVLRRYIQPSTSRNGFSELVAECFATVLFLLVCLTLYRRAAYPNAPQGIQTSITGNAYSDPPERLQMICRNFFKELILMDMENFLIYFNLSAFFAVLLAYDLFTPENLLSYLDLCPKPIENLKSLQSLTCCYKGFGIFRWFKLMNVFIMLGFTIMTIVSVINLYHEYMHLKRNEKMPVASREDCPSGNVVLLNITSPASTDALQKNDEELKTSEAPHAVEFQVEASVETADEGHEEI